MKYLEKVKNTVLSIDWKEVSPAVYVRYIMSIIVVINTVLAFFDLSPVDVSEGFVYRIVSIVLAVITIVVALVNTYYNNSTSKEAMVGDMVKDVLKGIDDASEKETKMEQITTFLESLKESCPDTNNNE